MTIEQAQVSEFCIPTQLEKSFFDLYKLLRTPIQSLGLTDSTTS